MKHTPSTLLDERRDNRRLMRYYQTYNHNGRRDIVEMARALVDKELGPSWLIQWQDVLSNPLSELHYSYVYHIRLYEGCTDTDDLHRIRSDAYATLCQERDFHPCPVDWKDNVRRFNLGAHVRQRAEQALCRQICAHVAHLIATHNMAFLQHFSLHPTIETVWGDGDLAKQHGHTNFCGVRVTLQLQFQPHCDEYDSSEELQQLESRGLVLQRRPANTTGCLACDFQ